MNNGISQKTIFAKDKLEEKCMQFGIEIFVFYRNVNNWQF